MDGFRRRAPGGSTEAFNGNIGTFQGKSKERAFTVAKEIQASRIKFVGRPKFDPVGLLDDVTREAYEHPLQLAC